MHRDLTTGDLGLMAHHMLAEGASAQEIVYAMERPDKHLDVLARAEASLVTVDIEMLHLLDDDGRCRISANGQGNFPCMEHSVAGAWD